MSKVMAERPQEQTGQQGAKALIDHWLSTFNAALAARDGKRLSALFRPDAHLRDIVALNWRIETISDRDPIVARLLAAATSRGLRDFQVDAGRTAPWTFECAGDPTVEAILRFETDIGVGQGHLRLKREDATPAAGSVPQAWTLVTALESLHGHDLESERLRREEPVFGRDWLAPNWADRRREATRYADRDPTVLVVGGGHCGIAAGAALKALGIDALVVDRNERIGDVWRQRYHGLKLHSPVAATDMPFIPFPKTWPKYVPKDKLANWLESYVEAMEVDYWTKTTFEGGSYDRERGHWTVRLRLADGTVRDMQPRHLVMATGVAGQPNMPTIPTLERYQGTVVHSSRFGNGRQWAGKRAFVFGTGTSAHDIAQDLYSNGAQVTLVQRGPTVVVNIEPSAHLYLDVLYAGEGPPLRDRDLIACSFPLQIMMRGHRLVTDEVKKLDQSMLEGLARAGFKVDFGIEGTGWAMSFLECAGGYYFNVGASDLIIAGKIGVLQASDIDSFTADGLRLKDGTDRSADLMVFATGFKGYEEVLRQLFGEEVAQRVGRVWGIHNPEQELRNMWTPTAQPGLWFTGGSFLHARIYSQYLAMQIKAAELGLTSSG